MTYNLQYGSTVPSTGISLAYFAPPVLKPDENCLMTNAVGAIPANKAGEEYQPVLYSPSLSGAYETEPYISQSKNLKEYRTLTSPMDALDPIEDETGAWHVVIRDGIFKVHTKYTSTIYASADSGKCWVDKVAAEEGWAVGTDIGLIYSIPESVTLPYLTGSVASIFNEYGSLTEYGLRGLPITNEQPQVLDSFRIKTYKNKLYQIDSIKINDKELLNSPIDSIENSSPDAVKGVDYENGIVEFTTSIDPADVIEISYRYSQKDYIFRGYYDETLGRYCDLNLNPSYGHTYDNGRDTVELLSSVVYIFLLPSAVYLYDSIASGVIKIRTGLKWTNQFVRWESGPAITLEATYASGIGTGTIDDRELALSIYGKARYDKNKFMQTFTADSPTVFKEDGTLGSNVHAGGVGSLVKWPLALVLAKLYVSPNGTVETVKMIDTRRRGGGVAEDAQLRKIRLTGDQLQAMKGYFDLSTWDGEPAMLNGVIVVELPKGLLDATVGLKEFTEEEIQEIVDSHVAAGVKAIVRYI